MKIHIYIISLILTVASCKSEPRFEERMAATGLSVPSEVKRLEFVHNWNPGDEHEFYSLQLSEGDYDLLRREIIGKPFFQLSDSVITFEASSPDTEIAYALDGTYVYKMALPQDKYVRIYLVDGRHLRVHYGDR